MGSRIVTTAIVFIVKIKRESLLGPSVSFIGVEIGRTK